MVNDPPPSALPDIHLNEGSQVAADNVYDGRGGKDVIITDSDKMKYA